MNLLLLALALGASAEAKIVVLDVVPSGGVEAATASAFTDAIATELQARGQFEVVSSNDLRTLLGVERQRQLLGCSEERCFTELGGVVGSRYVMSGSLAHLGDTYALTLQVLDTQTAKPLGRGEQVGKSLADVRSLIPYVVADATHTLRPDPPSKVLPIALIAVGGAAMLGGGIVGGLALSSDAQLAAEVGRTANETQPLDAPVTVYRQRAEAVGVQKTLALTGLIAGAALVAVGVVVFPKGATPAPLALVPGPSGVFVVGVFP